MSEVKIVRSKILVRLLALATVCIGVLAAGRALAEFYVAQDTATKKCTITDIKPDGQKFIMIGTTSYATKVEAKEARMKTTAEECPHKPSAKPQQ
jgi:hypothetical protein